MEMEMKKKCLLGIYQVKKVFIEFKINFFKRKKHKNNTNRKRK